MQVDLPFPRNVIKSSQMLDEGKGKTRPTSVETDYISSLFLQKNIKTVRYALGATGSFSYYGPKACPDVRSCSFVKEKEESGTRSLKEKLKKRKNFSSLGGSLLYFTFSYYRQGYRRLLKRVFIFFIFSYKHSLFSSKGLKGLGNVWR